MWSYHSVYVDNKIIYKLLICNDQSVSVHGTQATTMLYSTCHLKGASHSL